MKSVLVKPLAIIRRRYEELVDPHSWQWYEFEFESEPNRKYVLKTCKNYYPVHTRTETAILST
jgi:hypothetical protein